MANLTSDEWKKMLAEITAKIPDPITPLISAVLFTNKDYLIPPGVMYKAEHENKSYLVMNKKDVDKIIETVKEIYPTPPATEIMLRGYIPSIAGIPIIEDNKKIQEIMVSAVNKYIRKMEEDLFGPRPFVNLLDYQTPNVPCLECGGSVTHRPGCKRQAA